MPCLFQLLTSRAPYLFFAFRRTCCICSSHQWLSRVLTTFPDTPNRIHACITSSSCDYNPWIFQLDACTPGKVSCWPLSKLHFRSLPNSSRSTRSQWHNRMVRVNSVSMRSRMECRKRSVLLNLKRTFYARNNTHIQFQDTI